MRIGTVLASSTLALSVTLALPAHAGAQGHEHGFGDWGWEEWASVFADFFMGPETKEEYRWQGRITPGATLEVKGVNGRVTALGASGDAVEVLALKHGRRHKPSEVEIKVVEHEGGITICAVYPTLDPSRPNECKPGKSGRMSVRNNDVAVDFVVRVPARVVFVGRTVNGRIETQRLAGNVEAYTVNGGVRIEAAGYAQASTVNGSIDARLGKADWSAPLEFRTVNGSVTLALPGDANTDVRLQTVNGSIANDFGLVGSTRVSRRELSGTIGSGGRALRILTVNGSVRLRRAS